MNYLKGKMNEDDRGPVAVMIYTDEASGKVVIDFGKELKWVAFDKGSLRSLIDLLESKYKKL